MNFASGLALFSALLWGLWWIPIRSLEASGFGGVWASLSMSIGALPILIAVLIVPPRRRFSWTAKGLLGAVLIGAAVMLYGTALTFTDIVRAVLLFYLAPIWSLLLECLWLGRRWTLQAGLAVLLSFGGILLVFGGDVSFTAIRSGDIMALASGLCWSLAAALIFTSNEHNSRHLALLSVLSGCVIAGSVLAVTGDASGELAVPNELSSTALMVMGYGTIYLAPIMLITLWAAHRLPPATMSFILTAEIVSGVASSAILLDEPFGLAQGLGCALVIAGAASEVFKPAPKSDTGSTD